MGNFEVELLEKYPNVEKVKEEMAKMPNEIYLGHLFLLMNELKDNRITNAEFMGLLSRMFKETQTKKPEFGEKIVEEGEKKSRCTFDGKGGDLIGHIPKN